MLASENKIRFRCPSCGGKLAGDGAWAGAIVHCPHCAAPTFFPVAGSGVVSAAVRPEATLMAVELKGVCPSCQSKFRVDSRAMGREVVCPDCGRGMTIPRVPACPEPLVEQSGNFLAGASEREVEVGAFPLTEAEIAFLMAPVAAREGDHDSQIDDSSGDRDA